MKPIGETEFANGVAAMSASGAYGPARVCAGIVGNVEGHDLFTGRVDVVVMDGFTGNVVLKACETLARRG